MRKNVLIIGSVIIGTVCKQGKEIWIESENLIFKQSFENIRFLTMKDGENKIKELIPVPCRDYIKIIEKYGE